MFYTESDGNSYPAEKRVRCIGDRKVVTWGREITSCNMLEVEAGTNGYHGENSRAYLRVTTLSKADFYARVKTNEAGQPVSVELCFGGNDGINAILRVLDFAKQVLSDQLSGENT